MPQDIPVEAGETLAFTPDCLRALPGAPVFTLGTPTLREKRYRQRMLREEGVTTHDRAELRAEILRGLEALWSPADFAAYQSVVTDYWEALDQFELQKADDPKLKFDYDPDVVAKVEELVSRLEKNWRPLATMIADNIDFSEMNPLSFFAVTIRDWTGLAVERETANGYLTFDCADRIAKAMLALDKTAGAKEWTSFGQLYLACLRRFSLVEEEAKNSESPSPSETTQAASTETTASAEGGKSPASARSKKTPASA